MKALWLLTVLVLMLNGVGLLTKYRADTGHTTINLVDSRVRALEVEKVTLQRELAAHERARVAIEADLLICQRTLTRY